MADMTASQPPRTATHKGDTTLGHILYVLKDNPVTMLAFAMLAFFLGCAFFGPALVPYDPLATNAARALEAPSWDHWFGRRGKVRPEGWQWPRCRLRKESSPQPKRF